MEFYEETTVSRRVVENPEQVKRFFLILMVVTLALGLFVHMLFWIATVLLFFMYLWCRRNLEVEFDYTMVNMELDLDKVILGKKRKHMMTIELDNILAVAPVASEALEEYSHIPLFDFSSGSFDSQSYIIVCIYYNQKRRLKLDLTQQMLRAIRSQIGSKVIME